jgi:hypothetical protein
MLERRSLAVLLGLGAVISTAATAAAAPLPSPAVRALPHAPHTTAVTAPTPYPTPGNAPSAQRRRLRSQEAVDEGFILGLPGAGPRGPVAYVPPEPRSSTGDAAALLAAAASGLLAAVGGGAVLFLIKLRPPPLGGPQPASASVALAPAQRRRRWPPGRGHSTRLPREVFDRLPPLLQLAVLDRAGAAGAAEELGPSSPPPAG